MFDSGLSAAELVKQVRGEADISFPIPDESFYRWITAVEQLLYSELIQERRMITLDCAGKGYEYGRFPLSDLAAEPRTADIEFRDIFKVYAVYGGKAVELSKTDTVSGFVFYDKNLYWENGGDVNYSTVDGYISDTIAVIYVVRPALHKDGTANVMFPPEFIELVACKLRGEAYKISNEDALSAKWMASYNTELDNFKVWISGKNEIYGE